MCDGDGDRSGLYVIGGGVCCAVLITAIVLIVVSISSLETTEAGLRYNDIAVNVGEDGTVWTAGIYFLGVGQSFVKYPTTQQPVRFEGGDAIRSRTLNGLDVTLDVSFNFRIRLGLEDLKTLYYDFGEMEVVQTAFNRIARNVVRTVGSRFDAFAFFFNRSVVESDMQSLLSLQLNEVGGILDNFQLLDVRLPARFDDARDRQLVAVQQKEAAQNEKRVAEIAAQTRVNKSFIEVEAILIQARKEAEQIKIASAAEINRINQRIKAEETGFSKIRTNLNLSSQSLLGYVYVDALQEARASGKPIKMRVPDGGFKAFGG